jgi:stage II sporulation protein D
MSLSGRLLPRRVVVGVIGVVGIAGAVLSMVTVLPVTAATRQSKAAPYLPTTVAGSPSTTLVVAPGRVIVDGKGFGHGVGMAQDGAFWMGKAGKTATQIMKHFYPGTTLGKQGGAVRVPLGAVGSAVVSFPDGGLVGNVKVPPGRSVRVIAGGGVVSAVLGPVSSETPTTVGSLAEGSGGRFGVPLDPTPTPTPAQAVPVPTSAAEPTPPPEAVAEPTIPPATSVPVSAPPDAGPTVPASVIPPDAAPPTAPTLTASTVRLAAPVGAVLAYGGKRYRGSLDFIAGSSGMRVVNELDVEWYLRGMAEVTDPSWPAAALQSQAIAARTYALRMMSTRGEVCPTQACQVYVGAQAEYPAMNQAVDKTKGVVVLYKGALANTFYSASGGGTIAEPSEVFGPGEPIPYLRAGTYPTGDPKAWRVELSLAELGRRVGYPGTLYDAVVSKVGPSGRAVEVTFTGSSGPRTLTGPRFDAVLGLRSNNFRLLIGRSSSDPAPVFAPGQGPGGNSAPIELNPVIASGSPLDFQSGLLGSDATSASSPADPLPSSPLPSTSSPSSPSPGDPFATTSMSATTLPMSRPLSTVAPEAPQDAAAPPPSTSPSPGGKTEQAAALPDANRDPSNVVGLVLLGGAGLAMGWLALRWALRPEVASGAVVGKSRSKKP